MEITLKEALNGKGTRIKDKDYFPTAAYVEPFVERLSKITKDFRIQVKLPDQVTKTKDGDIDLEDITFNRLWIQAVLPEEFNFYNHSEVIGMVYGLDVRKPVVKIYRGAINNACTNLCVFNPSFLALQDLAPENPIDFTPVDTLLEYTDDTKSLLETLMNTEFDCQDREFINERLGAWIRNCVHLHHTSDYGKVKIATSVPIDAYKSLFENTNSKYYAGEDPTTTMFNIYNAFTDIITNDGGKDIMNKIEKTLLLKRVLEL